MNSKDRAKIEAQAEKLAKRGKLQDAIKEYRKLLTGGEEDIPILNTIGDLFVRADENSKAVTEFMRICVLYEQKGLYSKAIAIMNRVIRIEPDRMDAVKKLAKLYHDQGFASEASREYAKIAAALEEQGQDEEAARTYEILLELNPKDMKCRMKMAELLQKAGEVDRAVDEFNTVAEFHISKNQLDMAREILDRAKEMKPDEVRTLINLIDLYKREDKKKEAFDLAKSILDLDPENIKAHYLLGNLYLEDEKFEPAEKVFSRIVSIRPKEVDAVVKLGRILIRRGDLDRAFELYDPLVSMLLRKQMNDKAIGLLGLILASKQAHLPTLEKLAEVYKRSDQVKNLEVVYNVLVEQYRKNNLQNKVLALLAELVEMFPENQTYYSDFRFLKGELGGEGEEMEAASKAVRLDETDEIIESTLTKADLYVEQGLVKNARRMLNNLKMRFPDDERVDRKIEDLKKAADKAKGKDLANKVERVHRKETELFDQLSGMTPRSLGQISGEEFRDDRLTAADIFAETDLIPLAVPETDGEDKYFVVKDIITDELEAMAALHNIQLRGDTASAEKALQDIVSEFQEVLDEKVAKDDYDSHYNLGIAFMEQGLFDEAIEECKLAAENDKFAIDSLTMISHCFRQKDDQKQAVSWLEKALDKAEKGSHQFFALKYEMASLWEDLNQEKKAQQLYREVWEWDPEFREVDAKVKSR
jgi:tetratricopeptide (TPR) repeat protein